MASGKKKEAKIDGFTFRVSTTKGKKLDAFDSEGKKIASFGAEGYQHFHDRTGLLDKTLNHGDTKRREAYLKRHGAIKRSGKKAIEVKGSPAYFSANVLW